MLSNRKLAANLSKARPGSALQGTGNCIYISSKVMLCCGYRQDHLHRGVVVFYREPKACLEFWWHHTSTSATCQPGNTDAVLRPYGHWSEMKGTVGVNSVNTALTFISFAGDLQVKRR